MALVTDLGGGSSFLDASLLGIYAEERSSGKKSQIGRVSMRKNERMGLALMSLQS